MKRIVIICCFFGFFFLCKKKEQLQYPYYILNLLPLEDIKQISSQKPHKILEGIPIFYENLPEKQPFEKLTIFKIVDSLFVFQHCHCNRSLPYIARDYLQIYKQIFFLDSLFYGKTFDKKNSSPLWIKIENTYFFSVKNRKFLSFFFSFNYFFVSAKKEYYIFLFEITDKKIIPITVPINPQSSNNLSCFGIKNNQFIFLGHKPLNYEYEQKDSLIEFSLKGKNFIYQKTHYLK